MSGLGSSSNVRFTGLSAFGFCPTCGRGGQVRAVWPRSCPRRPQARREAGSRDKLFLGLRLFVQGPVRMEAGDFERSVEQGEGAFPGFENRDGALGAVLTESDSGELQWPRPLT